MLSYKQLIEYNKINDEITKFFKEDSEYGLDFDIDLFFMNIKNLSPQLYGMRAQKYFANLLNYKSISSKEDLGDFYNNEGEAIEFKCSFLTSNNKNINIRQIRLYQELDYYYVFTVDYNDYENIIYKCYKLTKEEMKNECELNNAKPCHKTKLSINDDEQVELGFIIKIGSECFKRFEDKYLKIKMDMKKLSIEKQKKDNEIKQLKKQIENVRLSEIQEILNLEESLELAM